MARASLRSLEPTWWPGAVANLFLVSSVGLLIYSDVGLSAQILTNAEEEVLGAASAASSASHAMLWRRALSPTRPSVSGTLTSAAPQLAAVSRKGG